MSEQSSLICIIGKSVQKAVYFLLSGIPALGFTILQMIAAAENLRVASTVFGRSLREVGPRSTSLLTSYCYPKQIAPTVQFQPNKRYAISCPYPPLAANHHPVCIAAHQCITFQMPLPHQHSGIPPNSNCLPHLRLSRIHH